VPWFRKLIASCGPDTGAVGIRAGRFEPLAAIYPRRFLLLARAALARGDLALQPLVNEAVTAGLLHARPITVAETRWFENWNTPAEIKGAR
jgi:molybdopterin-guanine dinucleotide biosynthesis protein A